MTTETFLKEIKQRYDIVEYNKQEDLGKPNHESPTYYYSEEGNEDNDEYMIKDNEEY